MERTITTGKRGVSREALRSIAEEGRRTGHNDNGQDATAD
jgi:hypothetical protein